MSKDILFKRPVERPYCKDCAYHCTNTLTCDYLLIEHHKRPCPAGEGCTVKRVGDYTGYSEVFLKAKEAKKNDNSKV